MRQPIVIGRAAARGDERRRATAGVFRHAAVPSLWS